MFENLDDYTFDWSELDRKEGTIHVGVDKSNGKDYTCIMFKSGDEVYLLDVKEKNK